MATTDAVAAYRDADFVVIATPTNYNPVKNYFDTTHVEEVIELVMQVNPTAIMVIKSTIPVGYTEGIRKRYACENTSLLPNSCAKAKPFMIISTRVASSLDVLKAINDSMKRPMNSLHSCRRCH